MKTVACVFKTGVWEHPGKPGKTVEFGAQQVRWLRDQIAECVKIPHRFVCLTDAKVPGVDTVPLKHNWPGWWSKMELFRPGAVSGDVFYLDLDTVLVGDITHMLEHRHKFSVLRNLSRGQGIGSGIMAWRAPLGHHLYESFIKNPDAHMAEFVTSKRWGDQGFIQDHQACVGGWDHLQDQFPGEIVSHKIDMGGSGPPPRRARVVVFHGKPKPWEVDEPWIMPLWPQPGL